MIESADDKFMRRCLELALKAEGMTYPNPLVGSVIVHKGVIIGEGYHLKAGLPHAEVNAINSVLDKSLLSKSTLYVSLEPCSHSGKTPPCTDFIIENKIPLVVVGTSDTSEKVSGKGISRLIDSGCKVVTGVLEKECRRINRRFFSFHEKKRPYITLKWAQSADGFIDINRSDKNSGRPTWITGDSERVLVHKWRSEEEAILVGAGTVRADNPRLNVRLWKGRNPVKIILSKSGELKNYFAEDETNGTVIVFTSDAKSFVCGGKRINLDNNVPASMQVIEYLYNTEIQSLFIEGGSEVFTHFIETGLWDEARVFTGMINFNDGVKAPYIEGKIESVTGFENSSLKVILNL
jgi:diaminohydroxyphosphoribosylaminopyrimidine deaminase/5-amino-6-(5-phosphoribosylamino)uracil reductase